MTEPRRFYLDRNTDVTGASGTGRVADGVVWPDGTVTIRWRGEHQSTVNWDNLESAERVHSHDGATQILFLDHDNPGMSSAPGWILVVRRALENSTKFCRFHQTAFGRAGTESNGEPRCDSCKQPWRVMQALAALEGAT